MFKKITKNFLNKLSVLLIPVLLAPTFAFIQFAYPPTVLAESSAANKACGSLVNSPGGSGNLSPQEYLSACYFGYDVVGPDRDSPVAESGFKGCFDKYGTSNPTAIAKTGACNAGASSYRGDNPDDPRYGDVHFHATDSDGKPVKGASITIANNSDCHGGATTGNDGNASIECRKGQNHQVKVESTNPKYKPVSGNSITVKVRQAPYQIKFTEDAQYKNNLQEARQACKDRDQQAADNNWAPIVSIDDCVTGYLAQLDGKAKNEACSIFGEGLGKQDCEIGWDLAQASGNAAGDDETPSCGGQLLLGWIICGITEAVQTFGEWVFKGYIQPMMEKNPLSTNPQDPFYQSWQGFRFLANILLVVSLLAVVYSQTRGGSG